MANMDSHGSGQKGFRQSDKRESRRINANLDAKLCIGGRTYPVLIGNLSETGFHIILPMPPGDGSASLEGITDADVKIRVNSTESLDLPCKKLWSTEIPDAPLVRRVGLLIKSPSDAYKKFYKSLSYQERTEITRGPIAVIGLACYYPGAPNIQRLWENIVTRRRQFRRIPDVRLPLDDYYDPDPAAEDKTYGTKAAVIDGFSFDWLKRGIPKSVVDSTDISHWLALETALKAVEDAGFSAAKVPPDRTGVILGNTLTGEQSRTEGMRLRWPFVLKTLQAATDDTGLPPEMIAALATNMEAYYKSVFAPVTEDTLAGGLSNTIAGRICNFLNLNGGGYTVDGACSSSLIAVATGATALSNGNLDLAIVGGVDISLDTFELIGFAKTKALTRDDMRVYDRRANGFIPGEGSGFAVLKRLEDARADGDYIYAVLRGWGMSTDGKGALTAPKAEAQALAIRRAYTGAGYGFRDIDFVEGHGSGTPAGDRAELTAIAEVLGDRQNGSLRPCGITSLKSLIGHTKAASGIGGFIKAVMAVNRRVLPPTANCTEPSQTFDNPARMVYPIMRGEIRPPRETLRAGVSGMGFGGINCHITLESGDAPAAKLAPTLEERKLLASSQETELFILSADSSARLLERVQAIRQIANGMSVSDMVDLAAQLSHEVEDQALVRAALIADSPEALAEGLQELESSLTQKPPVAGEKRISPKQNFFVGYNLQKPRVGFLFPGQGSQQLNMARLLVERHEWARDLTAKASAWLKEENGINVIDHMFKPLDRALDQTRIEAWAAELKETRIAQPAICLAALLWCKKLDRLGIAPVAAGGHSLGELTAFHAVGAFDEAALLKLAAMRGQAMTATSGERGVMASLACDYETAAAILGQVKGYAVAANINSPQQLVISGEQAAVEQAVAIAQAKGIDTRMLKVSNAFHSRFVAGAADCLRSAAPVPILLGNPRMKLFAGIGGTEMKAGLQLRDHFAEQVISQVDFVSIVHAMARECDLLLEVGPGKILSGLARAITGDQGPLCLPVESKAGRDRDLQLCLAHLFVQGGEIHWEALYEDRLVRPFVPASARAFIVNPCERPFKLSRPATSKTVPAESNTLHSTLSAATSFDPQVLSEYLVLRGSFLSAMIKEDIENLSMNFQPQGAMAKSASPEVQAPQYINRTGPAAKVEKVQYNDDTSIADLLLELVEKRTGFPRETLSLELRLLDDLNLDPIKSEELLAEASMRLGVAGDLNTAQYANVPISEVVDALSRLTAAQRKDSKPSLKKEATAEILFELIAGRREEKEMQEEMDSADFLDFAVEWIANRTGFPKDFITPQKRLRDDLNLDSIKVGELIITINRKLNLKMEEDTGVFANEELGALVTILFARAPANRREEPQPLDIPKDLSLGTDIVGIAEWVRTFQMESIAAPLAEEQPVSLPASGSAIVIGPAGGKREESVADSLRRRGFQTVIMTADSIKNSPPPDDLKIMILILPEQEKSFLDCSPAEFDMRVEGTALMLLKVFRWVTDSINESLRGLHCLVIRPSVATTADDHGMDLNGGSAFLKTIKLEYPEMHVKWLNIPAVWQPEEWADICFKELQAAGNRIAYSYDHARVRTSEAAFPLERVREEAPCRLTAEDVVLVTGGAKGITCELALALGKQTKAKLALLGSSPLPSAKDEGESEIAKNLQRFQREKITCDYFQCDITDLEALRQTAARIEKRFGPITALLHGAGISRLAAFRNIDQDVFLRSIRVKVRGVYNLLAVVPPQRLKAVHLISSVLGNTGMRGQADYTFANSWLDNALKVVYASYPKIHCLSVGYSVWSDTGLGKRLQVVDSLVAQGVTAMDTETGIMAYMELIRQTAKSNVFVITGRLGPEIEANLFPPPDPGQIMGRYLEHIRRFVPGTEMIAEADLSVTNDLYIEEHIYEGTLMFPGVMAIEAMVEAAMACSGRHELPVVRNIRFHRPLILEQDASVVMRILAVTDLPVAGVQRVQVVVRFSVDGFAKDFFDAECIFGEANSLAAIHLECPPLAEPLPIDPEDFSPTPLFQGKFFRRIEAIYQMEHLERCLTSLRIPQGARYFNGKYPQEPVTPHPAVRDAFLETAALVMPLGTLPASFGEIRFFRSMLEQSEIVCLCNNVAQLSETSFISNISIFDKTGELVETMRDIEWHVPIAGNRQKFQKAPIPINTSRLEEDLEALLPSVEQALSLVSHSDTFMDDAAHPLQHESVKTSINLANLTAVRQGVTKFASKYRNANISPANVEILHHADGKPRLRFAEGKMAELFKDISISIADMRGISFAVVGQSPLGVDVEMIDRRDAEMWRALLGDDGYGLALQISRETAESFDCAATRVWTLLEAGKKAFFLKRMVPKFEGSLGGPWLFFSTQGDSHTLEFFNATCSFDENQDKVASFTLGIGKRNESRNPSYEADYHVFQAQRSMEIPPSSPLIKGGRGNFHVNGFNQEFAGIPTFLTEEMERLRILCRHDPHSSETEEHYAELVTVIEKVTTDLARVEKRVNAAELASMRQQFQKKLFPYIDGSEIISHSLSKPFGYTGDFQLCRKLFENRCNSKGLGYHLDRYALEAPASRALRTRIEWVCADLLAHIPGRPSLAILDLGIGAAPIERWLAETHPELTLQLTAIDLEPAALEFVKQHLESKLLTLQLCQLNLKAEESLRRVERLARDTEICIAVGILEALTDEEVYRLLSVLMKAMEPGSIIYTENYLPDHLNRKFMEWFMDLYLGYRSLDQLREIAERAGAKSAETQMDSTGSIGMMKIAP